MLYHILILVISTTVHIFILILGEFKMFTNNKITNTEMTAVEMSACRKILFL